MNEYENTRALQHFVHHHNLMNSVSAVNFIGIVTIKTDKHKIINKQVKIIITFDGYDNYGTLTLHDNEINPYLFPTVLEAKWQTFKHVDNEYLNIDGFHKFNADIGKYNIKIIPLNRIRYS